MKRSALAMQKHFASTSYGQLLHSTLSLLGLGLFTRLQTREMQTFSWRVPTDDSASLMRGCFCEQSSVWSWSLVYDVWAWRFYLTQAFTDASTHRIRFSHSKSSCCLRIYRLCVILSLFLLTYDVSLTHKYCSLLLSKNNSKRTPVNTTTHKRHMPMVSKRRSVPSTFPPKEWTLNS
jgi:hypothetical protein